jgi:hypothetical protein
LSDLAGARETVSTARDLNTPYAVVINTAGASVGESNSVGRLQVGDCPAVVGDRPLGRRNPPRWTPGAKRPDATAISSAFIMGVA